jgi:hypothetical protein
MASVRQKRKRVDGASSKPKEIIVVEDSSSSSRSLDFSQVIWEDLEQKTIAKLRIDDGRKKAKKTKERLYQFYKEQFFTHRENPDQIAAAYLKNIQEITSKYNCSSLTLPSDVPYTIAVDGKKTEWTGKRGILIGRAFFCDICLDDTLSISRIAIVLCFLPEKEEVLIIDTNCLNPWKMKLRYHTQKEKMYDLDAHSPILSISWHDSVVLQIGNLHEIILNPQPCHTCDKMSNVILQCGHLIVCQTCLWEYAYCPKCQKSVVVD